MTVAFKSTLVASLSLFVVAQKCTLTFDGRIPADYTVASFDESTSIYDNEYIHGPEQLFEEILLLPDDVPASLFDALNETQAVEVTLNDASIFQPGGQAPQAGFRRSELIPGVNSGTDETVQGIKTFHWSLKTDSLKPLNYSHEYHLLWHETNDYSTSQWVFQTGTPFSESKDPGVADPRTLRLTGRQSETPEAQIWSTNFTEDVWHNFALTVGWDSSNLDLYYSQGSEPLTLVGPLNGTNDNTGEGQFHFGVFKMPTGADGIDVVHEGYQESDLDEGIIWGGVFIEDSAEGCVSLEP